MLVFTSVEVLLDRRVTGLLEPGEQFRRSRGSCSQVGPQFTVVCHRVQLCRGRVRVECAPSHRGKINIAVRLGSGLCLGFRLCSRSHRFGCSGLWPLRSILFCGATAGGRLLRFAIARASTLFSRLLIARVRLGVASRLLGRVAVAVLVLLARILLTVLARLAELALLTILLRALLTPALLISRLLTVLVLLLTEVSLCRLVLLAVLLSRILLAVLVLLGRILLTILLRTLLTPALLISRLLTLLAVARLLTVLALLTVLVLLIGRAVLLRV